MIRLAMLIPEQVSTKTGELIDVDWKVPEIGRFTYSFENISGVGFIFVDREEVGKKAKTLMFEFFKAWKLDPAITNMPETHFAKEPIFMNQTDAHSSLS